MAVVSSDLNSTLSVTFLESIRKQRIIQRNISNLNEALASVERGETWGVLKIGRSFSSLFENRSSRTIGSAKVPEKESAMDIYVYMTNDGIGPPLQHLIVGFFVVYAFLIIIIPDPNCDER